MHDGVSRREPAAGRYFFGIPSALGVLFIIAPWVSAMHLSFAAPTCPGQSGRACSDIARRFFGSPCTFEFISGACTRFMQDSSSEPDKPGQSGRGCCFSFVFSGRWPSSGPAAS